MSTETPRPGEHETMTVRYRVKIPVVDAVRWTGRNRQEVSDLFGGWWNYRENRADDIVGPSFGDGVVARVGDWIVRVDDRCHACKPNLFEALFEVIE